MAVTRLNQSNLRSNKSTESSEKLAEGMRLLQRGEHRQAIACFDACLLMAPLLVDALHFRGLALYQVGEKEDGLIAVKQSIEIAPDRLAYRQNLGGILLGEQRFEEASIEFQSIVKLRPDDFLALGSLCQAYYRLGRHAEAIISGQQCLDVKNSKFCREANIDLKSKTGHLEAYESIPVFDSVDRSKNVIAYSLWGNQAVYMNGILTNAAAAAHLFPEWTMRVYYDDSVPVSVITDLRKMGVQLMHQTGSSQGNFGLFWRFFVSDDPNVDRFLCRDADSPLTIKERIAVEDWIDSGLPFHLMRDNILHCELVLAGLWGGVRGFLPKIEPLARQFFMNFRGRWADQIFLREQCWSYIGPRSLSHDTYYNILNRRPFPNYGRLPAGRHVGGAFPRDHDNRMLF